MTAVPSPLLPPLALEDEARDVLNKACRGLGIDQATLRERAKLTQDELAQLKRGQMDAAAWGRIANELDLSPSALTALATGSWRPEPRTIAGLQGFNRPHPLRNYAEATVNAYVLWDACSRQALLFDAPGEAEPILAFLQTEGLQLQAILLTHAHPDHVAGVEAIRGAFSGALQTALPVYVHPAEHQADWMPLQSGPSWQLGGLRVTWRQTAGHSPGGVTYVIEGLDQPLAMVGDAIFAGSQGGVAPEAYPNALAQIRQQILSLPPATVLCPGHGPVTTVGEERQHNAFHAGMV